MVPGNLIHNFWIAQMVFQGVLAVVLLAKRAWNDFPLFTWYSVVTFSSACAEYLVYRIPKPYFYLFWVSEGISVLLGFAIVYEVFRHLFSVHFALRKLATISFIFTLVILLVLGWAVVYAHASTAQQNLSSAVLVVAEAARVLEVGLLMFLFVFAGAFGLHWRQPVFGICLGLGLYAAVELISVTVLSKLGPSTREVLSLIRSVAFSTSLLVWIGYLLAPERVTSAAELPKRAQLEQWNRAIMELINQ